MGAIGFLLTLAIIAGTIYYFTVMRKKIQDEKAKKEKIEAKNITASSNAKKAKTTGTTTTTKEASSTSSGKPLESQTAEGKVKSTAGSKKKEHPGHHKIVHSQIEHPLFAGSIKGFAGDITDYDYNKEYLVVASKDKHVRIFKLANLTDGPIYYFTIEFGHATAVGISPNSKHIAYAINVDRSIEIRLLDLKNSDVKKRSSQPRVFQKDCHKEEIMKLAFDIHNKFVISSAGKSDTLVKVWSLLGSELGQINTVHNQHYMARFSQQRKYYLIASWTSNLKALTFEVEKGTNEFKSINKAYGLSHGASISYVNIDNLDQKAVTISKNEKCIKFWDVDVKYSIGQDPKVLKQYKGEQEQKSLFDGESKLAVAAAVHSVDGKVFYAVTDGQSISVLNESFELIEQVKSAVTEEYFISKLEFVQPNDSTLLIVSVSFEECRMNIFNLSKYI